MIVEHHYDRLIEAQVVDQALKEAELHVPSGKLSASMLAEPLQWQVLKMYGFTKVVDPYVLRKFQRGKDVEERVLDWLKPVIKDRQKFVEYRGVVGFMDAVVDSSESPLSRGTYPFELKSVANAKFKRVVAQGKPDRGHALQGALYGLATGSEWFAVGYVASDDYRLHTFVMQTADFKQEIDDIIDRFNQAIVTGLVPVFDPPEKWMVNPKYNKFPDWSDLSQAECQKKLEEYLKSKQIA